ncbi:MAG: MBL fold metallo-hydrolase [Acidobacteriaceae bacterium]
MPHSLQLDRRSLLKSLACLSAASALPGILRAAQPSGAVGVPLALRQTDEMDIHHIDTGCGNSTLIVAPDGTTILIDAGATSDSPETSSQPRPNASRRPGQWQARYALRHSGKTQLDYFLATHIHPDHVGEVNDRTPLHPSGAFCLTGVSDVDELIPIATTIDRAYPDYTAAPPPDLPYAKNYLAFLAHRAATDRNVQSANVGSDTQIRCAHPAFRARILSANSKVWNGPGTSATTNLRAADDPPIENNLCVATRFTYGRFSYFAGGDLNCDTHDGQQPRLDLESPVVRAAGRTEVAAADHHGYFDACGPEFVHSLDAQAYIIQAWDIGHPGPLQMQRMLGDWSGKATHDVFATDNLPVNQLTNRRFTPLLKASRGHIVVRVAPGGDTYSIYVLDSSNEEANITAAFGPYICRR